MPITPLSGQHFHASKNLNCMLSTIYAGYPLQTNPENIELKSREARLHHVPSTIFAISRRIETRFQLLKRIWCCVLLEAYYCQNCWSQWA